MTDPAKTAAPIRARVHVFPRREILDPQGKALSAALARLGFDEVADVRAGKSFDIVLTGSSDDQARSRLESMCRDLLANPVIEDYSYELLPTEADGADREPTPGGVG